jgi:hypothetical protein
MKNMFNEKIVRLIENEQKKREPEYSRYYMDL